jgi:hypothetical protein
VLLAEFRQLFGEDCQAAIAQIFCFTELLPKGFSRSFQILRLEKIVDAAYVEVV